MKNICLFFKHKTLVLFTSIYESGKINSLANRTGENMKAEQVRSLAYQALTLHEVGNFESAEKLFLEALYLLDDKENELYQLIVYGLGVNYAAQKNYAGAKSCFEEGRINAQEVGNVNHELEMHHQLVIIARDSGDYEAAELLSEEEIRYRKKQAPDDFEALAAAYYEAAKIYQLWGKDKKLGEALKQAAYYTEKANEV